MHSTEDFDIAGSMTLVRMLTLDLSSWLSPVRLQLLGVFVFSSGFKLLVGREVLLNCFIQGNECSWTGAV